MSVGGVSIRRQNYQRRYGSALCVWAIIFGLPLPRVRTPRGSSPGDAHTTDTAQREPNRRWSQQSIYLLCLICRVSVDDVAGGFSPTHVTHKMMDTHWACTRIDGAGVVIDDIR